MNKTTISLAFFKAYQGKGSALTLGLGNDAFFLSIMPESGNRQFDSKSKITVALGQNDVGELLAVLSGRKGGAGTLKDGKYTGMYHEVKGKHQTSIHFLSREDNNGYFVGLAKKVGNDTQKLSINLSHGDAAMLEAFFRRYLDILFESVYDGPSTKNDVVATNVTKNTNPVIETDVPF